MDISNDGELSPGGTSLSDNLIHRVNVGDSLTRSAARSPDAVALMQGDRRLNYREFNRWSIGSQTPWSRAGMTTGCSGGARLGQQHRVPHHLLRLRQARSGLRAD